MSDVGNSIRKVRIKKGLSQSRLAKLSGVAQPTINSIEREEKTRSPNVDTVQKIAVALDCTVSELLGEQHDGVVLTSRQKQMLEVFDQLNESGKNMLLQQAEIILAQPALKQDASISQAE